MLGLNELRALNVTWSRGESTPLPLPRTQSPKDYIIVTTNIRGRVEYHGPNGSYSTIRDEVKGWTTMLEAVQTTLNMVACSGPDFNPSYQSIGIEQRLQQE